MNIIQKPSPNLTKGRGIYKPEIIVIHVMEGTLTGTDNWFGSSVSQVSAHYGIGQNGEVHQYIQEADTAYHAGRVSNPSFSLYKDGVNPNSYTIGIEHEGNATSIWSEAMKKASATLIKDICVRNAIPIDRDHIIGHYQIFLNKPNCPATNKGIIDELITLAQPPNDKIAKAVVLLEQALKILRS
jgi:N-acetyl-anhydromuramyl-L-alanine amidase AmpD